jgi:hypothetical protein
MSVFARGEASSNSSAATLSMQTAFSAIVLKIENTGLSVI